MQPSGRIEDISQRLFAAFTQLASLPPEKLKGRRRPSAKEFESLSAETMAKFFEAAQQERQTHKLGIISRARVAFGVQQRLLAAGYPAPLVKQVLFAMLTSAFVGKKQS